MRDKNHNDLFTQHISRITYHVSGLCYTAARVSFEMRFAARRKQAAMID